jgi:periplasmic divalent cation tolerance protein
MKLVSLFLTCPDTVEADTITKVLFKKNLIACVKQSSVYSTYKWQGKIENNEEILLIMDTTEDKFSAIEKEIQKVHSYKQFVLAAYPIIKSSAGVEKWLKESLTK